MTYNPPPHYNFGEQPEPQRPQSVPPAYSPQPPQQPAGAGYPPQQPTPIPTQPSQPGYATQMLPQPPPSGPRRSPLVPVLAVVMVIGLAGAVLGLAMWLKTSGDLEDAEARLSDRDSQISQLEEDLAAAETQLEGLEAAEAAAAEAESMRACLDDLKWFYSTAPDSTEEAEAETAVAESCDDWIW
ncbi:hypothetical protein K3N28_08400 [Glycomyces sp. TRM65418]|uniref:hypothetical protein n=1 Tax=Glycomyces sp. TRM65418 TaxID=2867006 RepID=UPI001CE70021|nr:hypothetical protein [Glycomyces sp. TRM65418]MCC3763090.1 hypothetical protein [Glycomyces sp. TRM65418]QZD57099.1 hypothetical protein K3N28_08345 [Glycomyces sp. TRM65418]